MSRTDATYEERQKYLEIKNKIKETFEQPQPQFSMSQRPTEQELLKVRELVEKEQGCVIPLPLPLHQIMNMASAWD